METSRDGCQNARFFSYFKWYANVTLYLLSFLSFKIFIVIQLQLYAFSPHPSTLFTFLKILFIHF